MLFELSKIEFTDFFFWRFNKHPVNTVGRTPGSKVDACSNSDLVEFLLYDIILTFSSVTFRTSWQ